MNSWAVRAAYSALGTLLLARRAAVHRLENCSPCECLLGRTRTEHAALTAPPSSFAAGNNKGLIDRIAGFWRSWLEYHYTRVMIWKSLCTDQDPGFIIHRPCFAIGFNIRWEGTIMYSILFSILKPFSFLFWLYFLSLFPVIISCHYFLSLFPAFNSSLCQYLSNSSIASFQAASQIILYMFHVKHSEFASCRHLKIFLVYLSLYWSFYVSHVTIWMITTVYPIKLIECFTWNILVSGWESVWSVIAKVTY